MTNFTASLQVFSFFHNFRGQRYQKEEILIRAGEPPAGIFYLESGFVRQYAISQRGDEITLNLYKPQTFFPMMWAINDTPNTHYFEAVTDVDTFIAPKEKVLSFIKKEPEVLYDLTKRLYKGIDGFLKRIEFLSSGDAFQKLAITLLISMWRFSDKEKKDKIIKLKLTHKDLASQSGLTRETVSREMKKLQKEGIISYSRNFIHIKNPHALEEVFLG